MVLGDLDGRRGNTDGDGGLVSWASWAAALGTHARSMDSGTPARSSLHDRQRSWIFLDRGRQPGCRHCYLVADPPEVVGAFRAGGNDRLAVQPGAEASRRAATTNPGIRSRHRASRQLV